MAATDVACRERRPGSLDRRPRPGDAPARPASPPSTRSSAGDALAGPGVEALLAAALPHPPRILVVDDHPDIRGPMARLLVRRGFDAVTAADGAEMDRHLLQAPADRPIDVILLDVVLPDEDGFSICKRLRAAGGPPVILLTARGEVSERVRGLELGAEDYVVKPFEPDELIARLHNVVRRGRPPTITPRPQRWRVGDWTFDPLLQELIRGDGSTVPLSSGETRLLEAFAHHAQQVLDRDRLLLLCRRSGDDVFDRSIDSHISRLRRKIEDNPRRPRILTTVWGNGYRLAVPCARLPCARLDALACP